MKKRWLSLLMLICFGIGFIGGCKDTDDSVVSKLQNVDGNDIVLKIGENKEYTANELFADMLNSDVGAQEVYERILRTVVMNSFDVDKNMTASWELMLDAFEEEVETTALSSGISEDQAREFITLGYLLPVLNYFIDEEIKTKAQKTLERRVINA